MAKLYGIHFRQQAEGIRALLGYWMHPTVEAKSIEHYRHQINTFVVLLFESAGRWGVEFDTIVNAGRPIFDVENAKRLDREAKEETARKAKEAEEKLAAPIEDSEAVATGTSDVEGSTTETAGQTT